MAPTPLEASVSLCAQRIMIVTSGQSIPKFWSIHGLVHRHHVLTTAIPQVHLPTDGVCICCLTCRFPCFSSWLSHLITLARNRLMWAPPSPHRQMSRGSLHPTEPALDQAAAATDGFFRSLLTGSPPVRHPMQTCLQGLYRVKI